MYTPKNFDIHHFCG